VRSFPQDYETQARCFFLHCNRDPATLLGILRPEAVLLTPILSTEPSLPVVSRQPSKAQEHSAKRNGGDFFSHRVSPAFCFCIFSFALRVCFLQRALPRPPPPLSGTMAAPEARVNAKPKYKKNGPPLRTTW